MPLAVFSGSTSLTAVAKLSTLSVEVTDFNGAVDLGLSGFGGFDGLALVLAVIVV